MSAAKPCPICGARPQARYAPFCSALCAERDLANWLGGHYRIPVTAPEEGDDEEPVGRA